MRQPATMRPASAPTLLARSLALAAVLGLSLVNSGCFRSTPMVESSGLASGRYKTDLKECQTYAGRDAPVAPGEDADDARARAVRQCLSGRGYQVIR